MKEIKPIYDHERYSKPIAKAIYALLYREIFKPLFDILELPKSRQNASTSALLEAIRSGKMIYRDGFFIGDLNAKISKQLRGLGAVYNKTRRQYFLGLDALPLDLKLAIQSGNELAKDKLYKVENFLKSVEGRKISMPDLEPLFGEVVTGLEKQFQDTTKDIKPTDIEIPLEPHLKLQLKQEYTENLNKYIQDWHDEEILRLREKVQQNVAKGFRAESMIESIVAERGVSQRKAEFLAKQETSLMVSKYRQIRYEDVGIRRYMWSTSGDVRVRHDHKELNGKIFSFDNPPITDKATGARNNPGEDFNCFPYDSNVNLAHGIKKCFRRWYSGELTTVITASGKTIRATPNHQVLTVNGWKAVGMLNNSDYIVDLTDELAKPSEFNIDKGVTFIGNIFESFSKDFRVFGCKEFRTDFHGDIADGDVDIVTSTRGLVFWTKSMFFKFIEKLNFTFSNKFAFIFSLFSRNVSHVFSEGDRIAYNSSHRSSCGFGNGVSFFGGAILKSDNVGIGSVSDFNSVADKSVGDDDSLNACSFRNRKNAFSGEVSGNNWFDIQLNKIRRMFSFPSVGVNVNLSKMLRKIIRIKADDLCGFIQRHACVKKFDRVIQVSSGDFSGHVYNLETVSNWFVVDNLIYHNCRCVAIPVMSGRDALEREYARA